MIICSCTVLTKQRVVEAAAELAAAHPGRPVTPARLFKVLNARPQCGICFATVRDIVAQSGVDITFPEPLAGSADPNFAFDEFAIIVDGSKQSP